jgi:hypothetical protein
MAHEEGNYTYAMMSCKVVENTYEITRQLPNRIYKGSRIALIVTDCLLLLSTIVLNGISVMAIRKSSQLKKKICYFMVLIQSVTDLGVGVLGTPLFIYCALTPFLHSVNCTFVILVLAATFIPNGISIITLSLMNFERYVAIVHPYHYQTEVTKKRILVIAFVSTIIFTSILGLSALDRAIIRYFAAGIIPVFILSTVFVYTRIYRVIRRLVRSEKRPACESDRNDNVERKQILRDLKHAKSCFVVVICYGILLLPLTLASFLFKIDSPEYKEYFLWSHTLLILNSSANSVIFFWTKNQLRKEALQNLAFFSCLGR